MWLMCSLTPDAGRMYCSDDLVVSLDDVTTVGEALATCDSQPLLSAVLSAEAKWRLSERCLGDLPRRTLLRKVDAALDAMANAATASSGLRDVGGVLVPWEWVEVVDSEGLFRRRVGAAYLDVRDAGPMSNVLAQRRSRDAPIAVVGADQRRYLGFVGGESWLWGGLDEVTLRLAFDPWEKTLSLPLWLPRSLREKERSYVLANVFWSMTYLGFDGGNRGAFSAEERDPTLVCGSDSCDFARRRGRARGSCRFLREEESAVGSSDVDRDYLEKLRDVAARANYFNWLDMLEAFVGLADLLESHTPSG